MIFGLLLVLTVVVSFIFTQALGYDLSFAGIFIIIYGIITYVSYYYSDKLVLKMSKAKAVGKKDYPELYRVVENLKIASGIPMPKVYVINDKALNAFATGRDPKHAAIAVTEGLLHSLKKVELEGVIAHELSHVRNYDTRFMSVVAIIVGSLALLSDIFIRILIFGGGRDRSKGSGIFIIIGLVAAILAPIAAMLLQLSISRKREFLADADGALLTRYPEGLALALEKISHSSILKQANHATAHLYISNPLKKSKKGSWLQNLYSTHPPAAERIRILRSM